MSRNRRRDKAIYKLGLRIAIYTGLISAVLTFIIIYTFDHGWEESLLISAMVMAATALTSYVVGYNFSIDALKF